MLLNLNQKLSEVNLNKRKFNLFTNFTLSIIGIYQTYFHFGEHVFFYQSYDFINIIASCLTILIFILIIYLSLNFLLILLSYKYLNKLFEATLFACTIFISYHYILRFSDLNYSNIYNYLFLKKNFFYQFLFYFYPFLMSWIIYLFVSTKKLKKINKFLTILLIILNILSVYRLANIYLDSSNVAKSKNDLVNFTTQNFNTAIKKKKVILLIFDEFDQKYFEKNKDLLNNLNQIYKKSVSHIKMFPPAKYSKDSIPGILMGTSIKEVNFNDKDLIIKNLSGKYLKFNFENSIFGYLGKRNLTSSIYGYYLPYCRIIHIDICFDNYNFKKEYINLYYSLKILSKLVYIDKAMEKIFDIKTNYLELKIDKGLAKFLIKNSENFINTDVDFIYIHYPFPHLPDQTQDIIKNTKEFDKLSDYQKNLLLVDIVVKNINETLKSNIGSMLIITSDHWFRLPYINDKEKKKRYPNFFISKIIGDDQNIVLKKENNSSSIFNLIIEYFSGNVKKNIDIKNFLLNEKAHKTFIREH